MRIEHLGLEKVDARTRITAQVCWEEIERPTLELYFETVEPFSADLVCSADPFLIAAIIPAFRHGEKRVRIDGDVSPELFDGLRTVMTWLRQWFQVPHEPVAIEGRPAVRAIEQRSPPGAGFFFSGGVDSLATLRANRLTFPASHPGSIKDGLLVYGLEVERPDAFEHAMNAVAELAADAGVTLVPVYSNVRQLDEDWVFYRDQFQGAILAAVGHALAGRLGVLSIAATYDVPNLAPWGSHPLIDPNFSTYSLRVHHDGVALSRLDKVRLLLDWPAALRRMRVCNKADFYRADRLNCGQCEKCVRTMLELLALGALERSPAFPRLDLTVDTVSAIYIGDDYVASCYDELLAPLALQGRADLVRGIEENLAGYRGEIGYRGALRRFDRIHLHGGLRALKRAVMPSGAKSDDR
jgi:hypothetical protein